MKMKDFTFWKLVCRYLECETKRGEKKGRKKLECILGGGLKDKRFLS